MEEKAIKLTLKEICERYGQLLSKQQEKLKKQEAIAAEMKRLRHEAKENYARLIQINEKAESIKGGAK